MNDFLKATPQHSSKEKKRAWIGLWFFIFIFLFFFICLPYYVAAKIGIVSSPFFSNAQPMNKVDIQKIESTILLDEFIKNEIQKQMYSKKESFLFRVSDDVLTASLRKGLSEMKWENIDSSKANVLIKEDGNFFVQIPILLFSKSILFSSDVNIQTSETLPKIEMKNIKLGEQFIPSFLTDSTVQTAIEQLLQTQNSLLKHVRILKIENGFVDIEILKEVFIK